MFVRILQDGRRTADVLVDGHHAARIDLVTPTAPWRDFHNQPHIGRRWIPTGAPADMPGPRTKGEAALIALVAAGHPVDKVMTALLITKAQIGAA